MIWRFIIFALINFGALAIGGFFTGPGVSSEWYQSLAKAPWTPPGWVFGFAWTTIMICFSFYLSLLWPKVKARQRLVALYVVQWLLNVAWNPLFFHFREVEFALIVISALTLIVFGFLYGYRKLLSWQSLLVLPYFLWLLIASSLNGYILLQN